MNKKKEEVIAIEQWEIKEASSTILGLNFEFWKIPGKGNYLLVDNEKFKIVPCAGLNKAIAIEGINHNNLIGKKIKLVSN